ncbi:MAG: ribosome-associated translation inhibitor RaiA [Propionibacteriaceae bacterium]|jgi:ribosomal subunit interface protein|nr:ribosome-associated translation inhibitor RaiA [Propionibacteriaceae bacterium]
MDIQVSGRHCQIADDFRERVTERLSAIEKLKDRVIRVDVLLSSNPGKRQPGQDVRVEITLRSRGPVVRAEAASDDKNVAFDAALDKLKAQLRKAADRRKAHRGERLQPLDLPAVAGATPTEAEEAAAEVRNVAGIEVQGDGPLVVREKEFEASPLTLAQALDQMELVGHDFFLYVDAESGKPSVVYRRLAYDYGVIHLNIA